MRADTGAIGGSGSQEFHVLADSGEDAIAFSDGDDYAANLEMAVAAAARHAARRAPARRSTEVADARRAAPSTTSRRLLKLPPDRLVKTLVVDGSDGGVVALLVRGDHELNAVKAQKLPRRREAAAHGIERRRSRRRSGAEPGFLGPGRASRARSYADHSVAGAGDFVCGANKKDAHFTGVNWGRDLPEPDGRPTCATWSTGDPSPTGKGTLTIVRGIEVGHIFQLGQKYSEAMGATVLDESGKAGHAVHGLLRHRCDAHRCRGHRAEPR